MGQKSLIQMLEEVAGNIRSLEHEKAENTAKIQALERQVDELRNLISLAESKVDEMLEGGSAPDASRDPEPAASKVSMELPKPPAFDQEETKRRSPHAFKQNLF
jgi:peptidoglycan hydrolase CwlO-like protein